MDAVQASSISTTQTNSPRRAWLISAETLAQARAALDAVAPYCAPVAERWDAESTRRAELRTPENLKKLITTQREYSSARLVERQAAAQKRRARADSKNPLSGARRAARTAQRAARTHRQSARIDLKTARRAYPSTLKRVAVRAHTAHVLPAGVASYALSTPADWAVWPVTTSVALIVGNWAVLALGRLAPQAPEVEGDLTAEERRLVERLDPSYWTQHADERGLSGTVPTPAEVTPAGLVSHVRLDGRWTAKALAAKADEIRALIGARTDLRMEITAGTHGDRAKLTLRTRSAADGDDLRWSPSRTSFGVDTITGELVDIPLGERLLIAGRSGAGKSVASRPLLHRASEGATERLVIIDLKKIEGRLWDHRARVASDAEAVIALVEELVEELDERLDTLPKGQATLVPTATRPRITVVVDEGAEVVSVCDGVQRTVGWTEKGKEITERVSALPGLESLARMGRAACIDLWWMTQKPTIGDGVPKQIAPQMSTSICLSVRTPTEARVVLGEDAQAKGWHADELPAPGVAYVRDGKRGPAPVAVRYMTDAQVMALPDRPIWSREGRAAEESQPAQLRLVKEEPSPTQESADSQGPSNRTKILAAVKAGARTNQAVADRIKVNKGTVSGVIKRLVESGELVRGESGLTLGEGVEVSA